MIKVFDKPIDVAEAFAEFFYSQYKDKKEKGKELFIALSGGNTPKIIFQLLADKYADKIDWKTIHFYWGDERMVPVDNSESNYGVAKKLFFDKIKIPEVNVHFIKGEREPENETNRYACNIKNYVPSLDDIPIFDIIMLGMGDDGHTLSIFPNQIDLMKSNNICEVAVHPKTNQTRITLTGKIANNAKNIIFLVTGENKAEVLKSILNKEEGYEEYPSALITPESGKLFWYLDSDAAKYIQS